MADHKAFSFDATIALLDTDLQVAMVCAAVWQEGERATGTSAGWFVEAALIMDVYIGGRRLSADRNAKLTREELEAALGESWVHSLDDMAMDEADEHHKAQVAAYADLLTDK